jgi:Na+/proline symporter
MGIAFADWFVLIAYLIVITAIGLIAGLRVKGSEDYFLGDRKFGRWLMVGQSFGVGTHSEMPVAVAGAVYTMGMSGIWYQWKNLFATPFYWVLAPVFRRVRRATIAELTEDRYGPWMGGIYVLFALTYFTINTASMLKGAGKVIHQATGGGFSVEYIVIGMTVAFLLYSFVGGLVAAAWTDFFQGFLIIALSFLLIPLGWGVVGGLGGMKESMEGFKFSLATPEGVGVWVIAILTINGLVGIVAQPHILAAVGTGKDERTCREGFFYGNFIKRLCTVGWAVVGLMVAAMIAQGAFGGDTLADPEYAFGYACRHLLFPGGVGLLIACVMAANMSTCSAFMVDSGALFTQGFYRRYVVTGRADTHYLWAGRFSGLFITLVGVVYALFLIDQVLYSFLLTETMATYMGISIFGGLIWTRANRWGALASLIVALATNFYGYHLMGERLDHWDPNVFLVSLIMGILALVIFSLLTAPESRDRTDSFFQKLHTSSDEDRSVSEGPLLVVNILSPMRAARKLGFIRTYWEDLSGFVRGTGICTALVVCTWLYFKYF